MVLSCQAQLPLEIFHDSILIESLCEKNADVPRVVDAFGHWSHELAGEHGRFVMAASQIWGPSHVRLTDQALQDSLIIRLSKGGDKIAMPKLLKNKTLPLKAEKGVSTSQDSVHFLYQSSKGHADHSGSFHKHIQTYSPPLIHKLRHSSKMQAEAPARAVLRSCSTLRTLSPDTTPYLEVTGVKRQKNLG